MCHRYSCPPPPSLPLRTLAGPSYAATRRIPSAQSISSGSAQREERSKLPLPLKVQKRLEKLKSPRSPVTHVSHSQCVALKLTSHYLGPSRRFPACTHRGGGLPPNSDADPGFLAYPSLDRLIINASPKDAAMHGRFAWVYCSSLHLVTPTTHL